MQFPTSFFSTLIGLQIQIQNNGAILFYSGTPATGNLVISIAGASGTDPYGNAYPSGFTVFDGTESIVLSFTSTGITIQNGTADGQLKWFRKGLSLNYVQQVTHLATLIFEYLDASNVTHDYANISNGGFAISVGSLVSSDPNSNPAIAETWHNATLNAGFANAGAPSSTVAYQMEQINGKRVRLTGQVNLTAAHAAGAVIFTVGAGYAPANSQEFAASNTMSGVTGGRGPIFVDQSGNVTTTVSGSSGNFIHLDGVTWEID